MSEHYLDLINSKLGDIADSLMRMQVEQTSPCATYKPKFGLDGNQFYFLLGGDLQSGVAGFGNTPALAAADFDRNFLEFDISKCHKKAP